MPDFTDTNAKIDALVDAQIRSEDKSVRTDENIARTEESIKRLSDTVDRYIRERAALVERLKKLSADEWQKTAMHEAFDHYSVFIMFRHLLNHEMLHAYRIEELLIKKDWD